MKRYKPTGKSYEIATIMDLFNLPAPQRLRCAREIVETIEIINSLEGVSQAVLDGIAPGLVVGMMPETFTWVDDGKRSKSIQILGPEVCP